MLKDYYKILQVSKDSTLEQIKKNYRALARKYHPDFNPDDPKATQKMEILNEAYAVLSDSQKRADYDRKLHYFAHNSNPNPRPNPANRNPNSPRRTPQEEVSTWDDIPTEVKVAGTVFFSGLIVWGISKLFGK